MTENEARMVIYSRTPIDYIIKTIRLSSGDWEFMGKAGEDVLTFRVHKNGSVTER